MKQPSRSMNFLVAGGAGYIGSVTAAVLIEKGHRVTIVDNLATGHRQAINPDARFIRGDISDKNTVESACSEGIDAAMHFASYIEVGESVSALFRSFGTYASRVLE